MNSLDSMPCGDVILFFCFPQLYQPNLLMTLTKISSLSHTKKHVRQQEKQLPIKNKFLSSDIFPTSRHFSYIRKAHSTE